MRAVYPDFKEERVTPPAPKPREEGWFNLRNAAGMLFQLPGRAARKEKRESRRTMARVPIRGVRGDLPVRFAPEGAVPGDRIVGIMQPGSGITIYPIQSPSLTAFDDQPERWIDVRWDIDEEQQGALSGADLVTAINAPGRWPRSRRSSPPTTPTSTRSPWCAPRRISPKCSSTSKSGI